MFKNCKDAIDAIENRKHNHSGLEQFKKAMDGIGNPQDTLKSIHIAGTNGKGSTTDFVRSVLETTGYKVGTFTSPYLVSHHDRIRINNVNIDDEHLLYYINQTKKYWDKFELSMFEIDMMIASLYFKDEDVDFAIFEVGMGGRLDATNVLKKPLVCAITNIGKDHMQFLGNTLEEIAYEKAGIIKEHVDCISASNHLGCIEVFKTCCESKESTFLGIDEIYDIRQKDGICFKYKEKMYCLRSNASYQCRNAALAIEIIQYLNNKQIIQINDDVLKEGLLNTEWAGRFEVMRKDPLIIIDGAHNEDGIHALVQSMSKYSKIKVIFSCLSDKNGKAMIQELMNISDDITVCEFDFYRADSLNHLSEGMDVKVEKDYQKAILEALEYEGVLLICGSLYFISIVRKYLQDILKD